MLHNEMKAELEKNRNFEIFHGEKMTPRFLALSKISKKNESLDCIKDDSGADFSTGALRGDHIRGFYYNIYNPPDAAFQVPVNCVRDFLGEEICENPVVKNSILTVAEKESFDTELTIQELDKAINELNVNSAGGEDGIGTKFLKQFWPYL
jgi:hypothetical protein